MSWTFSKILNRLLNEAPPERLFHYTSPNGIIGIASTKEIWATNVMFLNDLKEINQAIDQAKHIIEWRLEHNSFSEAHIELLHQFKHEAGSAAKRYYVTSFTELRDSLSQWRAYCPDTGGFAIGFPSQQLNNMANEQNFRLVKCIYNISHQNLLAELISQRMFNSAHWLVVNKFV